jgi:hypothetical protein
VSATNPEDQIADSTWYALTQRQQRWLAADGIRTLADLAKCPAYNPYIKGNPLTSGTGQPIALLDLRGFGPVRLARVRYMLAEAGLDVADAEELEALDPRPPWLLTIERPGTAPAPTNYIRDAFRDWP